MVTPLHGREEGSTGLTETEPDDKKERPQLEIDAASFLSGSNFLYFDLCRDTVSHTCP